MAQNFWGGTKNNLRELLGVFQGPFKADLSSETETLATHWAILSPELSALQPEKRLLLSGHVPSPESPKTTDPPHWQKDRKVKRMGRW